MRNSAFKTKDQLFDSLYSSLKELGLSEKEIEFYVLSLFFGPTSLRDLADALKISRPNIYKLVAGLSSHNLAARPTKGGFQKKFVVESPTRVLEEIRKKRDELLRTDMQVMAAMPDLIAMHKQGELPADVKVWEGQTMFVKSLELVKEQAKDQIEFFGSFDDFVEFITWDIQQNFVKSRLRKRIKVRALVLSGPEVKKLSSNNSTHLREIREFQTQLSFVCSFQMFADKILLWQPRTPLAILISDSYLVAMFKSMFYSIWNNSKPL